MSASPTQSVSVDTEDLAYFVDRGRQYATTLDALLDDVRRLRMEVLAEVGSVGPLSVNSMPALQHLVDEVRSNNAFVERVLNAMAGTVADHGVICRPLPGELCSATDADRARALAAMVAGLSPDEVDMHWSLLPPSYRRYHALGRHIDEAKREREVADGSSWSPWDGDEAALAAIDKRLAVMQRERAELAELLGMGSAADGGDGMVDRLRAVAVIAEATGGFRWEGAQYAEHFVGFRDGKIDDGSWPFGWGAGRVGDPRGNDVELRHIGRRIASAPDVALAFYNGIGVERAADLPTFLVGNGLSVEEFNNYGRALGSASQAVAATGEPALEFSGESLMTQEKRATKVGVVWYSPALLFADGGFESSFLAEATVATLLLAEAGSAVGRRTHLGDALEHAGTVNGGEDPRNILLDQAIGDPDATRRIIEDLGSVGGRDWQAGPRSGTLDPLLKPRYPFDATVGPEPDIYWLDRMLDTGNVADPRHPRISPIAYPELRSDYPIVEFLDSISGYDDMSRWILRYTANSLATEGPMVKDPGTATGLDLIMARHATLMFEPSDLEAVGVDRTGINDGARAPVEAKHWKAVHGDVLRFGGGQALAVKSDQLLEQAIGGAIDPSGRFNAEAVKPLAHMAARTEAVAYNALFDYSAGLDAEARWKNRLINVMVSAGLGLTGLTLGPVGDFLATAADVGWTALFNGYKTDNERDALRTAFEAVQDASRHERWKTLAVRAWFDLVVAGLDQGGTGTIPMLVPGLGWIDVALAAGDDPGDYLWFHPLAQNWSPVPLPSLEVFDELFLIGAEASDQLQNIVLSTQLTLNENFVDGKARSTAPEDMSLVERQDALDDTAWTVDWIAQPPEPDRELGRLSGGWPVIRDKTGLSSDY